MSRCDVFSRRAVWAPKLSRRVRVPVPWRLAWQTLCIRCAGSRGSLIGLPTGLLGVFNAAPSSQPQQCRLFRRESFVGAGNHSVAQQEEEYQVMCDYSLHQVASRPAKVGEKLVSSRFTNSMTHG